MKNNPNEPLLMEGEAGSGKTDLREALARASGLPVGPVVIEWGEKIESGSDTEAAVLKTLRG